MFGFYYKDIDISHKLDKPSSPTEEYHKHIHSFNEILYFVRGNVTYTVESETVKLGEDDIVFIPSGKYHFATVDLSEPYERYVLKFPDNAVAEHIRKQLINNGSFYPNCKNYKSVFALFDDYNEAFTGEDRYLLCLCEIMKLSIKLCYESVLHVQGYDNLVDAIIRYVNKNIHEQITLKSLSERFHYSTSHINIEFKRKMKVPIMQYIRSKKIIAAHQMILDGAKKSDTAEKFGFDTYSTFYRAYKKMLENDKLHRGDD